MSFVELDTAIRTPSPSLNMTFKIKVGTLMVPAKNWPEMVRIDVEELFEEHNEEHHSSSLKYLFIVLPCIHFILICN